MSKVDEYIARMKRGTGGSTQGMRAIEDSFQELTRAEQEEVVKKLLYEVHGRLPESGNGAVLFIISFVLWKDGR